MCVCPQDGLFSDQGRLSEVEEIMDMLDTGGRDLPGSVSSVSSVLLTFLAALAEPVVPTNLHQRCMECYNNTTLCKQVKEDRGVATRAVSCKVRHV